jgi:hypothetical protein
MSAVHAKEHSGTRVRQLNVATLVTCPGKLRLDTTADLAALLRQDTGFFFPGRPLEERDLGEMWAAVRDLVLAPTLVRLAWWSPGPAERMELSEEIVWELLQEAGGARALRTVLVREVSRVLPRPVAFVLVQLSVRESVARLIVRLFLELAAREMCEIRPPAEDPAAGTSPPVPALEPS